LRLSDPIVYFSLIIRQILACAITRSGRVFADFIVCTADRYSGPALLARQIIPADFAVTNYLGCEAVYSNKYTVFADICACTLSQFLRNDCKFEWTIEIFLRMGAINVSIFNAYFSCCDFSSVISWHTHHKHNFKYR